MKNLSITRISAAISLAFLLASPSYAQWVVIDPAAIAEAVTQTAKMEEQYTKMKEQLDQLKKTYQSLNGMRSTSDLLKDDLLKQAVPLDYQKLLDAMDGKGGASISGKMDAFTKKNQTIACDKTALTAAEKKTCTDKWATLATQNAMGQSGYDAAYKELENIKTMLDAIKKTKDPKEIADLQARLMLQQIKGQNESNKMQAFQIMVNAKEKAAQEDQKNQIQAGAGKRLTLK